MPTLRAAATSMAALIFERVIMVVSCLSRKSGDRPSMVRSIRGAPSGPMCWRAQDCGFSRAWLRNQLAEVISVGEQRDNAGTYYPVLLAVIPSMDERIAALGEFNVEIAKELLSLLAGKPG
jgi:hypothetical protein